MELQGDCLEPPSYVLPPKILPRTVPEELGSHHALRCLKAEEEEEQRAGPHIAARPLPFCHSLLSSKEEAFRKMWRSQQASFPGLGRMRCLLGAVVPSKDEFSAFLASHASKACGLGRLLLLWC